MARTGPTPISMESYAATMKQAQGRLAKNHEGCPELYFYLTPTTHAKVWVKQIRSPSM